MWGSLWGSVDMPKIVPEMPDSKIRSLRHKVVDGTPKTDKHTVGGVAGLKLKCEPPKGDAKIGARYWVLFYSFNGDRREKNFGSYPTSTAANVKELARRLRHKLAQGIDPREEAREKTKQLALKQKYQTPFKVAAQQWHDWQISRPNTAKRDYTAKYGLIKKHILPNLGDRPIGSIEYEEGLTLLRAIWEKIPPSAWKVQGGCKQIFDRAGLKDEKNIFQWTGNLDEDLPHPDEFHQRVKLPSLHWRLVPELIEKLQGYETIGAKALMLHALTVGRSETICLAAWEQIDFDNKVWNRPPEIMKAVQTKKGSVKYPHSQPLSDSTIEFLLSIKGQEFDKGYVSEKGLIFRGSKGGRIYDVHLSNCIPELGYKRKEVTVHGFRSSFKDWSLDDPMNRNFGELITEKCMAHQIGDEVRNTYAATEFVTRRRPIIDEWCKHCFSGKPVADNVSDISEARA